MAKDDETLQIPVWALEQLEDTLRIAQMIENKRSENTETCYDRDLRESLNIVRKLLKGERLTGGERFENL